MLTDQQKIAMRNRKATDVIRTTITALLASKGVTEEIGPPRAYFVGSDGNNYQYQLFKTYAADPADIDIGAAFNAIPDNMKLVWRTTPEVEWHPHQNASKLLGIRARAAGWFAYARFVAIPKDVVPQVEEAAA